jgi:small subunit ribosomal protein S1
MLDKKQDTFFDDHKESDTASEKEKLLKMMDSFEKKIIFDIKIGTKVEGIITKIGPEFLYIDIQTKNDAIIKRSEFEDENKNLLIKIGDTISAYILSNTSDEIILSKKLSSQTTDKQGIFDALKNQIPVQGKVTAVSKDGLTVKIFGQRAFCPISQIDTKFTEDVNSYLDKTMDFVITKISEGGKNIIVSRIPLLEQGLIDKIIELENSIEPKTVFHGTIVKITDFGLFVNINGIDGLVHISEISWEHITKPSDFFTIGQEIDCIVLKVIKNKPIKNSKISLSMKQVSEDPWKKVESIFLCGQSVQGKVVKITNFGAFIELLPGVDGLIHISEMSWIKRIHHPSEVLTLGNTVNVTILAIDTIKKSISLSLKDVSNDPWHDIDSKYPVGKDALGTIVKKSRYGYFIDLAEGITGLLVFSNISSDVKDSLKEGETLRVNILSCDKENRRISLSYGIANNQNNPNIISEYETTKEKTVTHSSTEFGSALLNALNKKR